MGRDPVTGDLRVDLGGGAGHLVLLLLHGMGATGDVWRGWTEPLAERWPGRWLAPDLAGHGGSAPLDRYAFDTFAAGLAGLLGPGDRVVVLGHSLGGVVGLALAGHGSGGLPGTGPGWVVEAVVGLGVKVDWTPEDLGRAAALAARPVAWYDSRAEAAQRYLRISGLAGLLEPDDPAVDTGLVRADDGRWRLAMDPRAFGVGAPEMGRLLAEARAAVLLARGEYDPMVTDEQFARLGVRSRTLSGLGHNAHVEDPAAVLTLLDPFVGARS